MKFWKFAAKKTEVSYWLSNYVETRWYSLANSVFPFSPVKMASGIAKERHP
jgi:hypothetical protein